jgi:hypothetical protein
MDDKYKQLHLLVDRISARLAEAEQENIVLRAKMRTLESALRVAQSAQAAARALKEWKDVATAILKKLYAKIDREIERIEARSSVPRAGGK